VGKRRAVGQSGEIGIRQWKKKKEVEEKLLQGEKSKREHSPK